MKRIYFQLIITLLCVACTHSPADHTANIQPQTILVPDSLWTPTGDAKLDSLLQLAAVAPQDTNLARLYYQVGKMYQDNDFEKAKEYYLKLEALSELLDWNEGLYFYASAFSLILRREHLNDSAVTVLRKALELAKREENELRTADMLSNIGSAYFFRGWYQMALSYYLEAIPVYEKMNKYKTLQTTYNYLSQLYGNINVIEKAIEYGEKSVAIDNEDIYAYCALARAYSSASEYEKANSYFEKALRLSTIQNNSYMTGIIYYYLAEIALNVFDLEKAEKYAHQALEIARKLSRASCCVNFTMLSKIEMLKGHYAQSEAYAKEALEIAIEHEMLTLKRYCYVLLAELDVAQGRYRDNIQHWNEWDLVDKEIASETVISASEEMAAKYETEKKELKISALETEKRMMTWLSVAGGIALLLALSAFFFLWRWTVQKQRLAEKQKQLAEQQVIRLEQEKQLIATQSLLDGETRERVRLARDLHDGLGSLLTGVKMNFLELKKAVRLEFDEVQQFDQTIGLLDRSVQEMRRVAHHLMPDALMRFGLQPAINDFCLSLPRPVQFDYYGEGTRLNPQIEVMIYSTILELVNNALKHAAAENIIVQIVQDADRIAFDVQDDGCGFDPSLAAAGMGLQNVRTRVAAFNGILYIDSRPDEGTEIHVELKVES